MEARSTNPALAVPGAMDALQELAGAITVAAREAGLPNRTLHLAYLRASQINGCSVCVGLHAGDAKKAGATDDQLWSVAAWRETPYFSDAERSALALTEEATRLADRHEQVSDAVWDEAARHHDEGALAALVLGIATVNFWNRLNATTRQVAGATW